MSEQNLSSPPKFLPTPEEPSSPWKQWKESFIMYMVAIGAERYGPVRRQAILLHLLGVEGRRLYEDLPELSLGMGDGLPSNVYT